MYLAMDQNKKPVKIVVITDMDFHGSGYFYLATPILSGLADLGYDIKVIGFNYQGTEHDFPFSIIPVQNVQDALFVASNLNFMWVGEPNPCVFMVFMDLPQQEYFHENLAQLKKKYVCIAPLENGPLKMSWAAFLYNIDGVFFISELAKQEALKVGVHKAEHLMIGVDSATWHPAVKEEKDTLRKGLGLGLDDFVILTVADNQERKNIWAAMDAVSKLKAKTDKPIKHILVTREKSQVGYNLRDLAVTLGINQELMIFERGIPVKDLWGLYAVSDVFLLTSKAEGLGMPVLEAMACGIPVVATDTGALHELLENDRGILVPSEYVLDVDVWGNSKRNFIDREKASMALYNLENAKGIPPMVENALKYARSRTWDIPVQQLDKKIQEIYNESK
jgi:glycosyltransferase involved in cell wall biosynthesis